MMFRPLSTARPVRSGPALSRSVSLAALALSGLVLAACTPSVPDSGAGVGFQDYNTYIRNAQAQPVPAPQPVAPAQPAAGSFSPGMASAALDRAGAAPAPAAAPMPAALPAAQPAERPRGNAPATIRPESGEVRSPGAGISDENDFNAVAARESIESDADRIARNRAQYVVVQPGALPQRPGDTGPNIVEYALATTHAPGTMMYGRSNSARKKDPMIPCARYASPDLAQQAFLANGGPDKDREGLDPDGDGFACSWDPRPFRNALR